MYLTAAALLLGLVSVLVAVYRDSALDTGAPVGPAWEPLPMPSDIARFEFPMSVPGYDPASVELHLETLRRAYEDLVAVAPPEVLARARRRAAERAGVALDELPPEMRVAPASTDAPSAWASPVPDSPVAVPVPGADAQAPATGPTADQVPDGTWPSDDSDALRLEAVLARVDPPAGSSTGGDTLG